MSDPNDGGDRTRATSDRADGGPGRDDSGDSDHDDAGDSGNDSDHDDSDGALVWLVERTYSDDELNLIILVYATEDGRRYHRRERALTSFSGPARETKAGLSVDADRLGPVDDPETRERYAAEASRMADRHDPDDAV